MSNLDPTAVPAADEPEDAADAVTPTAAEPEAAAADVGQLTGGDLADEARPDAEPAADDPTPEATAAAEPEAAPSRIESAY